MHPSVSVKSPRHQAIGTLRCIELYPHSRQTRGVQFTYPWSRQSTRSETGEAYSALTHRPCDSPRGCSPVIKRFFPSN